MSGKYRKHVFANVFFSSVQIWIGLHIVVMITSIDLSQEIFAIDIFCDCYNYLLPD